MTDDPCFRRVRGPRLVYLVNLTGHRKSYQDLFTQQFALTPAVGRMNFRNIGCLIGAEALLFGTIDDDYVGFFAIALCRAVLGRRTVGLFLCPQTCFGPRGLRNVLKKLAFMGFKLVPNISVFTIVPFSAAPQYRHIATDGLFDPQMWDINLVEPEAGDSALAARLRQAAKGRRVLAFIGSANVGKGIEFLRDLVADPAWPHDELLPVVAGRFPDEVRQIAVELSDNGALVLDRFISDAELYTLYAEAELIWACYRPDYDQASGIFGRALQFGRIPIVRAGSLISEVARNISCGAIDLEYGSPAQVAKLRDEAGSARDNPSISASMATWKSEFEAAIADAL